MLGNLVLCDSEFLAFSDLRQIQNKNEVFLEGSITFLGSTVGGIVTE